MPNFYNGTPSNVTEPSATIIGATNLTPITIQTSAAHLFSDGDRVVITGVRGNTAANSPYSPFTPWTITFVDATHFSLNGSAGNGAYVDGGIAVDVSLNPPSRLPSDGDPPTAASVNGALENDADRDQFLWERVILLDSIFAPQALINWHPQQWLAADPITSATAIVAIDSSNLRVNNSAECFYSPSFKRWFVLGNGTPALFLMGDEGYLEKATTGIALSYTHGVEQNGKALLFDSSDWTTNPVTFARSDAVLASWATVTLDANPGYTHVSVQDSMVLANGHLMVVGGTLGGGFDALRSWTSTDNGTTWTSHSVHALYTGGPQYLAGISVGKTQRVFAWLYDTAGANGGDIIFYTDNEGASWTATTAIAHGNIRDVIYVSAFDRYLVLTTAGYALTTDPTDPTLYDWNTSAEIFAAATDGQNIVYAKISTLSTTEIHVSQDMMTSSWTSHLDTHQPAYFLAYGAVTGQWGQFATLSSYAFRASSKVIA
jgi:hypothetical protein